jgi:hypothetical protein
MNMFGVPKYTVNKGNKETPSLVEIGSPSTPLVEPNITLVEKALRPRYALNLKILLVLMMINSNTHAPPIE